MAEYTQRLNLKKPAGNDLIRRQDFCENWDKIDNGIVEIENRIQQHVNDKNNPHAVTYAQIGAAPSKHTHAGNEITSPVPEADTVDGKHADSSPNNIPCLDSNGFIALCNLPCGEGGGLDADTVDGRHYEELRAYNFVEQGLCSSGTKIYTWYQDYKVALIPLIDKFPQDIPYLEAPQITSITGGVSQQGAATYIAVQGVSADGKRGALAQLVYEDHYPSSSSPISLSWSSVAGGVQYNVYVAKSYGAWKLYTTTTGTSADISDITGTLATPSYDLALQQLRLGHTVDEDGFTVFFENYKLSGQSEINIGVSKTLGETYQLQTQNSITAAIIKMRMGWTLNWSGFSGECTWGVSFKIRWKRVEDTDWLGTRTFAHQESWGSQWIGGKKSYSVGCDLVLTTLQQGNYMFEVYDIQEWKNNGNYWFSPHNTVYIDKATFQVREKVSELWGIYLIFAK